MDGFTPRQSESSSVVRAGVPRTTDVFTSPLPVSCSTKVLPGVRDKETQSIVSSIFESGTLSPVTKVNRSLFLGIEIFERLTNGEIFSGRAGECLILGRGRRCMLLILSLGVKDPCVDIRVLFPSLLLLWVLPVSSRLSISPLSFFLPNFLLPRRLHLIYVMVHSWDQKVTLPSSPLPYPASADTYYTVNNKNRRSLP